MTAKRFTIKDSNSHYVGYDIIDNEDYFKSYYAGRLVQAEELCNLLNELHEQVQAQITVIKEYQNRNEILHQQICDKNKILLTEIEIGEKLHDENTHIKQTIQDMIETERTELGRSVLRQLWEAIQ